MCLDSMSTAAFRVSRIFSLFFFFGQHPCTVHGSHKLHFSNFFIINGFHSTIYTFTNYFATVFSISVFSLSKNKHRSLIKIFYPLLLTVPHPVPMTTCLISSHSVIYYLSKCNYLCTYTCLHPLVFYCPHRHTRPITYSHSTLTANNNS